MPPACQSLSNTSKGTTENILYKAANKVLKQNKKTKNFKSTLPKYYIDVQHMWYKFDELLIQ